MTKKEILAKLNEVMDPELNISVVELGLIYGVKISGAAVDITMTLTTPFCPLGDIIKKRMREKLLAQKNIKRVNIELSFEPPWTTDRIDPQARIKLGLLS